MNTTVIASEEYDFGAGKDRRIQFVGCRWTVDDRGCLHVYTANGPVAAFAEGTWRAVTNGTIQGSDGVLVSAVAR